MNQAIKYVQDTMHRQREYEEKIKELQRDSLTERLVKQDKIESKKKFSASDVRLDCRNCSAWPFAYGHDLRVVEETHHCTVSDQRSDRHSRSLAGACSEQALQLQATSLQDPEGPPRPFWIRGLQGDAPQSLERKIGIKKEKCFNKMVIHLIVHLYCSLPRGQWSGVPGGRNLAAEVGVGQQQELNLCTRATSSDHFLKLRRIEKCGELQAYKMSTEPPDLRTPLLPAWGMQHRPN
ncbi:unnamed protein product [Ranitomeya imitator]|uniref:Uncharacterized protein n=1 Tax=Ranitomeya imitator TaxID=111125 RepID=A0ABN9L9C1_9NEOB|nr:unnamed protein product [Ranitomeya imitator]